MAEKSAIGIAGAIRKLRSASGMTQSTLAAKCNAQQPTISAWEAGKITPDQESLGRLAEALGVKRWQLMKLADTGSY